jgi:ABC-type multidrug transport system permease subunit
MIGCVYYPLENISAQLFRIVSQLSPLFHLSNLSVMALTLETSSGIVYSILYIMVFSCLVIVLNLFLFRKRAL